MFTEKNNKIRKLLAGIGFENTSTKIIDIKTNEYDYIYLYKGINEIIISIDHNNQIFGSSLSIKNKDFINVSFFYKNDEYILKYYINYMKLKFNQEYKNYISEQRKSFIKKLLI